MSVELDGRKIMEKTIPIVQEAASFIRKHFGETTAADIEFKEARSMVTYVDKEAEKILVKGLSSILPNATYLTEEDVTENEVSDLTWVIDPLDGTTNFLQGIPFFSVSVALRHRDKEVLGVVYDIMHNESFTAVQGEGAQVNGVPIGVKVSGALSDAVIATGFPYSNGAKSVGYLNILKVVLHQARGVRRLGSAALDLAYVAAGRLDGYYEYNLNAWDIAAGAILVREAGGKVVGFYDDDGWTDGKSVIAGKSERVKELRHIIQGELDRADV